MDKEYYVMEGDIYVKRDPTQSGVHEAAVDKMENETPDFVVFNGSAGSLSKERALKARVGETVRIFFGNAGPNAVSSFHVIGEIFDKVHPEGATETLSNVQSTLVPAGGRRWSNSRRRFRDLYSRRSQPGPAAEGRGRISRCRGTTQPKDFSEPPKGQPRRRRSLMVARPSRPGDRCRNDTFSRVPRIRLAVTIPVESTRKANHMPRPTGTP